MSRRRILHIVTLTLAAGALAATALMSHPVSGTAARASGVLSAPTVGGTPARTFRVLITHAVAGAAARILSTRPFVYLIFDDGPGVPGTQLVLAVLKQNAAHATFFEIGYNIPKYPYLVRAVLAAGDRIGNHTQDHLHMTALSPARELFQLTAQMTALARVVPGYHETCYHAPFLDNSPSMVRLASSVGLSTVFTNLNSEDWTHPGATVIADTVIRNLHPGSVVGLHDGPGNGIQAAQALVAILKYITAKGWTTAVLPSCR